MRESAVEAKFRLAVKRLGGRSYKIPPAVKGIPDRLVLLPGGIIQLVELKADGGRLSPAQTYWHAQAAALGVIVQVVTGPAGVVAWERKNRHGNRT